MSPAVRSIDRHQCEKMNVLPRCILRRTVAGTHINNFRPKKHLKMKKPVCCSLAVTRYQGEYSDQKKSSYIDDITAIRYAMRFVCFLISDFVFLSDNDIYICGGIFQRERDGIDHEIHRSLSVHI